MCFEQDPSQKNIFGCWKGIAVEQAGSVHVRVRISFTAQREGLTHAYAWNQNQL